LPQGHRLAQAKVLPLAEAGVGIAFVDDLSARAHRPDGLAFVALPQTPRFAIYTVVNVNRPLSQLGKAFLSIAKTQLAELQRQPLMREPGAVNDFFACQNR
jgi:DNA-binding transcriptional LysR family regulator